MYMKSTKPDWDKMKVEYIGGKSYRQLAEEYSVSSNTILSRMRREHWTDLRNKRQAKINAKLVDKMASDELKRTDTIMSVADLLLQKITEGVESGLFVTDPQSVRQITASLKDLRDIKGIKSDIDLREQEARIEKLRKEVAADEATDNTIKVYIGGSADEYAD